jgi:hypothetical protein
MDGDVARVEGMWNAYILVWKVKGDLSFGDLCIDNGMLLKRILKKQGVVVWTTIT